MRPMLLPRGIYMANYPYVRLAALVMLIFCCSGCGIAEDTANELSLGMQKQPGKLFSPVFYQRATPEEVKKEIDGKSLANAEHLESYKTGMSAFNIDFYPFTPRTGVQYRAVTPLSAAIENTPYPEVIRIVIEAGAVLPFGYDLGAKLLSFLYSHPTQEAFDLVLPYLPQNRCQALTNIIGSSYGAVRLLELYFARFPDMDLNCRKSAPLHMAVDGDQKKLIAWMVHKGAKLKVQFADGYSPAKSAALHRYWNLAQMLIDLGADTSTLTAEELKNIEKYGAEDLRR